MTLNGLKLGGEISNLGGKKAHLPNFKPVEVSNVMKFVNTEVS